MAAAPFLDEAELSPAEIRYERVHGAVDEALSADTRQGRYASLLATYLVSEAQDREALFVETARRLSRCEEAATRPASDQPGPASAPSEGFECAGEVLIAPADEAELLVIASEAPAPAAPAKASAQATGMGDRVTALETANAVLRQVEG